MILDIVHFGDSRLRTKAQSVPFITPELRTLAENMIETMHHARGVGLAAEQVGRTEALCVIDVPLSCEESDEIRAFNASIEMPLILFNPEILSLEGEQEGKEGCLSLPNLSAPLTRAAKVTCHYRDEQGQERLITAQGFLARAIQHETDHLKGILYTDLIDEKERAKLAQRVAKRNQKNPNLPALSLA